MQKRNFLLLHIEDDSLWRELIATLLGALFAAPQLSFAPTMQEGLAQARTLRPDLVLLDLWLPDGDGFALAGELLRLPHPPRILLLSGRTDAVALYQASHPHIAGLIWKNADAPRQLPAAIREIAAGRKFYPPEVREALRRLRADPHAFFKIFSPRELEFAALFGRGLTDEEAATRLHVSPAAARSQRQRIMQKLGLHRTVHLVHWAIRTGFVDPSAGGDRSESEHR